MMMTESRSINLGLDSVFGTKKTELDFEEGYSILNKIVIKVAVITPANHALPVKNTYFAIPNSSAIAQDSVEKISPMMTSGRGSMEDMVVRMVGIVSRIMTQILVTTLASGETTEDMSAAGILMTGRWMSAVRVVRSWDSAGEVVVVTAKMSGCLDSKREVSTVTNVVMNNEDVGCSKREEFAPIAAVPRWFVGYDCSDGSSVVAASRWVAVVAEGQDLGEDIGNFSLSRDGIWKGAGSRWV
ncbi:hypothetical protein LXL04_013720 [Taraxacum kok-saghyz]